MFELENADTNLLVVDSHELVVNRWLQTKQGQRMMLA